MHDIVTGKFSWSHSGYDDSALTCNTVEANTCVVTVSSEKGFNAKGVERLIAAQVAVLHDEEDASTRVFPETCGFTVANVKPTVILEIHRDAADGPIVNDRDEVLVGTPLFAKIKVTNEVGWAYDTFLKVTLTW